MRNDLTQLLRAPTYVLCAGAVRSVTGATVLASWRGTPPDRESLGFARRITLLRLGQAMGHVLRIDGLAPHTPPLPRPSTHSGAPRGSPDGLHAARLRCLPVVSLVVCAPSEQSAAELCSVVKVRCAQHRTPMPRCLQDNLTPAPHLVHPSTRLPYKCLRRSQPNHAHW